MSRVTTHFSTNKQVPPCLLHGLLLLPRSLPDWNRVCVFFLVIVLEDSLMDVLSFCIESLTIGDVYRIIESIFSLPLWAPLEYAFIFVNKTKSF